MCFTVEKHVFSTFHNILLAHRFASLGEAITTTNRIIPAMEVRYAAQAFFL